MDCYSNLILKITAFALVSFSFYKVQSQDLGLINYSIKEGLSSNEVYDVYQDSSGFIWFATDHGVIRFDGFKMKILTVKDGLADPVVFGFSEDEQKRIWFRTYSGRLSYYFKNKIYPVTWSKELDELVQNNLIFSLYSHMDTIYFSTEKSIAKIDPAGKLSVEKINEYELTVKIIKKKSPLIGLWGLSHKVKTIIINDKHFKVQLTDTVTHNKVIYSLQDGNRTLLTINSDIFEFDGVNLKKAFTGRTSIISLSKDDEGFYWVGYPGSGVDRLDLNYNVVTPQFLSGYSITKVLQDHEGGFWFSTLEQGVFYTNNLAIKSFELAEKTRYATFNSEYCVIGDQKGFISTYQLSTGNLIWKKNFGIPIRALFITADNQLWISSNLTFITDLNTGRINKSINGSYTGFSESDSAYWAVGGLRLSKFDSSGNSNYVQSRSIHLSILKQGSNLLTSGRTGLEIYDERFNSIAKPEIFINSRITTMIKIGESDVLIGTIGNGFHVLHSDQKITSFNNVQNSIASDIYYAQQKDSLIWVSTEKGLISIKAKSIYDKQLRIRNTISRELLNERITFFSVTENSIWALSDKRIRIFPLKTLAQNTKPIFYYELINTGLEKTKKIELSHNDPLQIRFGFISFSNQYIYVRYRIKDGSDWIETTDRILNLLSIEPGNYNLHLQFSLDHNTWSSAINIPFRINPPWWGTWYFRTIVLMALTLAGFLIYKRGIKQYKERNTYLGLINEQQKKLLNAEIEATERERSRIAKELHDGISTDLATMKFIAEQLNKKTETEEATAIQHQLQRTIADIRSIVYDLTPPGISKYGLSAALQNYVAKLNEHGPVQIKFDFLGNDITDTQVNTTIFRIIQELVSNSIRHALSKTILIHINVFADYLNIVYTDDGIGFDPASINPGLGLSNIQSRVDSLNGSLDFESGKTGTAYSIDIPLKK